ncbi:hypothetical protein KM043_012637 [Ampulex compressa]|nr:hypothetical protein KM043_012637 [Ampulex compressa]
MARPISRHNRDRFTSTAGGRNQIQFMGRAAGHVATLNLWATVCWITNRQGRLRRRAAALGADTVKARAQKWGKQPEGRRAMSGKMASDGCPH